MAFSTPMSRGTVAVSGEVETSWSHTAVGRVAVGSFTRTRVERIITIVAALASVVLGVQSLVTALDQEESWREDPVVVSTFVLLAVMISACVVNRGGRLTASVFAVAFIPAIVIWPLTTTAPILPVQDPWIWYLLNISTLAAIIAFPLWLQVAWAVLIPLIYGVVRLSSAQFPSDLYLSVGLGVSFALLLGGMLVTLGWIFRRVAQNVDATRAAAVDSYARAAAAEAVEEERVSVAALLHDGVLGALIAAERADTDRRRCLAVSMAHDALTGLASAELHSHVENRLRDAFDIGTQIADAASEWGGTLRVESALLPGDIELPSRAADALVLAAGQAIANAIEHARGRGLAASIARRGSGVVVTVSDTGGGFDTEMIPGDRLGVVGSILARMNAAGGEATVTSGPSGTVVTMSWPKGES